MTTEQIDSLCLSISDEIKRCSVPTETDLTKISASDLKVAKVAKHPFVSYLYNVYYIDDRKNRTAIQEQVGDETLLRLTEGKLHIEEAEDFRYRMGKYLLPAEMMETEYFFLNEQLVKISQTIGRTDYNVYPQHYWIIVSQLDFVYHDTGSEKKSIYRISSSMQRELYPTNVLTEEEWRIMIMGYTNITEEQMKANAYQLYNLYVLDKSLFNHRKIQ